MVAAPKDLYIEQGASFEWYFQWCFPDVLDPNLPGDPRDLTNWTFRMQIRAAQGGALQVTATTANTKIKKGIDPATPGMTPDPTNGWVKVDLTSADTDALTTKKSKFDVEADDNSKSPPFVVRLWQGNVTVDPNMTQVGTEPVLP